MANKFEEGRKQSPEERTTAFFQQDVHQLGERLSGMWIQNQQTGQKVRVDGTKAYEKDMNRRHPYTPVLEMDAGRLFACDWPFRNTVLPLVSALDGKEIGACVQITEAAKPKNGEGVEAVKRIRDVATILSVEKGTSQRLAFLDDSDTLYVVQDEDTRTKEPKKETEPVLLTEGNPVKLTPEEANAKFAELTQK